MKIGGVEITGDLAAPNEQVLVLPRRSSQIIFTARALPDMEGFEKAVSVPTPPKMFQKGKGWVSDLDNEGYKQTSKTYVELKVAYYVVASLQDIEWVSVDLLKPKTWLNWENDLKAVGFSEHECNLVCQLCFQVNQLDEKKLEQARQLFVLGLDQQQDESYSPNDEQSNTPSGEAVSDSE